MNHAPHNTITLEEFEQLVVEAIKDLPQEFKDQMENVDVTVAEWPTHQELRSVGLNHPHQLLGLYHGVPKPIRNQATIFPDKITIYYGPIVSHHRTPEAIKHQVVKTVKHEIAHHFGISDHRLREKGY